MRALRNELLEVVAADPGLCRDVADGSFPDKLSGSWVAKVIVGSQQLDRETFSL